MSIYLGKMKGNEYVSPIPCFHYKTRDKIMGFGCKLNKNLVVLFGTHESSTIETKIIAPIKEMTDESINEYNKLFAIYLSPNRFTNWDKTNRYINYNNYTLSIHSFINMKETFSKFLSIVREKIESTLWKTIDCCPFINIMDILMLKQWDTDSRLEHLDKINKSLIDHIEILEKKINSLEMSLLKKKI